MMPKVPIAFLSVLLGALWVGPAEPAMTDKDKAELATAVSGAKVNVGAGLDGEQEERQAGFRQVRNREREAATIRVYCQRWQQIQ